MDRPLLGFPHASGADGRRKRQIDLDLPPKAKTARWATGIGYAAHPLDVLSEPILNAATVSLGYNLDDI